MEDVYKIIKLEYTMIIGFLVGAVVSVSIAIFFYCKGLKQGDEDYCSRSDGDYIAGYNEGYRLGVSIGERLSPKIGEINNKNNSKKNKK